MTLTHVILGARVSVTIKIKFIARKRQKKNKAETKSPKKSPTKHVSTKTGCDGVFFVHKHPKNNHRPKNLVSSTNAWKRHEPGVGSSNFHKKNKN